MQREITKKKSVYILLILLLLLITAMVIVYWYSFKKEDRDIHYLSLVVEQRVLSQELAKSAASAASGNEEAFINLRQFQKKFAEHMDVLSDMKPMIGEGAVSENLLNTYNNLDKSWKSYNTHINTILRSQDTILILSDDIKHINEQMPDMLNASNEVAEILVDTNAPSRQIYLATQQLMFIERITGNISVMMSGNNDAAQNAQRFGLDTATFKRVLDSLIKGSEMLGVTQVNDPDAAELLIEIAALYDEIKVRVANILERSPETFEINNSALVLYNNSNNILTQIGQLGDEYETLVSSDNK
ncbi:MAG: type IV pili methyl-accepting chemotaxis transducer N-terminal domain-containing protein, partial [Bacteroidales bacterium]|nr:type IV pili methyl-accepting chemotaxis transducer N-terminal domain-containing protein [Bacteroidales bacterium]